MTCVVCRRGIATKPYMVGGRDLLGNRTYDERPIGDVCGEECGLLLWEAHFDRFAEASKDVRAETAWKWRRRIAEVANKPFTESLPQSTAERAIDRAFAMTTKEVA